MGGCCDSFTPTPSGGGGGTGGFGIFVYDEGVQLPGIYTTLDFQGDGVVVTNLGGGVARVTIPGGGGIAGINVYDDGVILPGSPYTDLNFTGDGVTVTDVAGVATVDIPGGGIIGGTPGAVIFVDAGGGPGEDAANFFWDVATHRLGIGTNAPGEALHVVGNAHITGKLTVDGAIDPTSLTLVAAGNLAYLEQADGQSVTNAPANRGRARYNAATQAWEISANTGNFFPIATNAAAFTAGSVPFADSSGRLTQDNARFFWDNAAHRLGVGNNTPGTPLDVTGIARATNVTISAMTAGSALFAGAAGAVSQDNANYFYDATNHRLGIGTTGPATALDVRGVGTFQSANLSAAGSAFLSSDDGASAAVSSANTGRLRYNNTAKKWQVSIDTAAYVDIATGTAGMAIGGTVTSGTTGSVLYVAAGPVLAQDNANFFWDGTNHRLGLGLTGPASRLDILETANQASLITLENTNTGTAGAAALNFKRSDGQSIAFFGYSNSGHSIADYRSNMYLEFAQPSLGDLLAIGNATRSCFNFRTNDGASVGGRMNVIGPSVSTPAFPAFVNVYHNTNDSSTGGIFVNNQNGNSIAGINCAGASNGAIAFFGVHSNTTTSQRQTQIRNDHTIPMLINGTNLADIVFIVNNTNDTSYSGMGFGNGNTLPVTATVGSIGYGRANVGITGFRNKNFMFSGGDDWVMGNATTVQHQWGLTTNSAFMSWANGSSAAASAASTGRLIYTTTGQKFQVSANTGSYFDIATYAAALTAGSVVFANSSNQLAQDNSTFFYDSTNHRLGLGTTSPQNLLHLQSGADTLVRMRSTASTGVSATQFYDDTNTLVAVLGYGNTASTDPRFTSRAYWASTGSDIVFVGTNVTGSAAFTFRMQDTEQSFQIRAGDSAPLSASGTARLRYNGGTDKLQVSKNGAAYVDIV